MYLQTLILLCRVILHLFVHPEYSPWTRVGTLLEQRTWGSNINTCLSSPRPSSPVDHLPLEEEKWWFDAVYWWWCSILLKRFQWFINYFRWSDTTCLLLQEPDSPQLCKGIDSVNTTVLNMRARASYCIRLTVVQLLEKWELGLGPSTKWMILYTIECILFVCMCRCVLLLKPVGASVNDVQL